MMTLYPIRFYYVVFQYCTGVGSFVTHFRGEFNIAEATKGHTAFLKESSPIIITSWREITAKQFTDFMEYVNQDRQDAQVRAKKHLKLMPTYSPGPQLKDKDHGPPIQGPPDSA